MSETKWTPGPWEWDGATLKAGPDEYIIWPSNALSEYETTSQAIGACGRLAEQNADANARLISAAPDMAEALADFLENPQFQVGVGGNPNAVEKMLDRARSALAKARGEKL